MSVLPIYKFDGYTLRPAEEKDRHYAHCWNVLDPDHQWELSQADYWLQQGKGVNSYVVEFERNRVAFFFKMIRLPDGKSLEVNMQFPGRDARKMKAHVVRAMIAGFGWLEKTLPENGIDTVYFNSKSEPLIVFAQTHLGFVFDSEAEDGFKRFKRVIPAVATV